MLFINNLQILTIKLNVTIRKKSAEHLRLITMEGIWVIYSDINKMCVHKFMWFFMGLYSYYRMQCSEKFEKSLCDITLSAWFVAKKQGELRELLKR